MLWVESHIHIHLGRCRLLDVGSYVATPPPPKKENGSHSSEVEAKLQVDLDVCLHALSAVRKKWLCVRVQRTSMQSGWVTGLETWIDEMDRWVLWEKVVWESRHVWKRDLDHSFATDMPSHILSLALSLSHTQTHTYAHTHTHTYYDFPESYRHSRTSFYPPVASLA